MKNNIIQEPTEPIKIEYGVLTEKNFDKNKSYPCHGPELTKKQVTYYRSYYKKLTKKLK